MSLHILHVDDNRDDAELVQFKLTRLNESGNIDIEWVGSARDALDAINKKEYDCIICDFQMPQMDGLDLLKELRTHDIDIPFIFPTGQGNEQLAARALREGADDYYTKELGFAHYERLINSIRRLVDNKIERSKRRSSERKILQLADTASDMILTHDVKGTITYVNRAVLEISGYSESELLGRYILDFMPASQREELGQRIEARILGYQGRFTYEVEFISKGGRNIPLEVNSSLMREEGQPAEVIVIARDVSDRRTSEQLLRQSEENFRLLFELSPVGFFMLDSEGKILNINKRAGEYLGENPEDLKGRRISELSVFSDDNKANALEKIKQVAQEDKMYSYELPAMKNGNKLIDIEIRMNSAVILGKRVVLGSVVDISKRKEAEKILQQSELRYRTLFETASDSILMMSHKEIIDCNMRTLEMFGCKRDQIIGRTPFHFSPEYQPDGQLSEDSGIAHIEAAIDGIPQFFEWKHIRLDGTGFDAEVSLNSLKIGEESYLQAIVRDVSDKKELNRFPEDR